MVAIKDMETLPSCCHWDCPLCNEDGGECMLSHSHDTKTDTYKERAKDCPLVEIEPLSDEEKRIFLSSMGRERVICKQIDIDKVDDGSIKKLVPIVNTIERKVKKILWK